MRKDRASVVCSIYMRTVPLLAVLLATIGAGPQDELVKARQLDNEQLYTLAIELWRPPLGARRSWPMRRRSSSPVRCSSASARKRPPPTSKPRGPNSRSSPAGLSPSDQAELVIALGELLYLDDQPGAAAVEFERALDRLDPTTASRERVLDWWASAVDLQAQMRPDTERVPLYLRIVARMEDELRRNDASAVSSDWLVAGTRGSGDLNAPGTPRSRPGRVRRSRATAARSCAPTSIRL